MIFLSKLLKEVPSLYLEDTLIYLVAKGFTTVVNDLAPEPHIEYDTEDLPYVWSNIIHHLTNGSIRTITTD